MWLHVVYENAVPQSSRCAYVKNTMKFNSSDRKTYDADLVVSQNVALAKKVELTENKLAKLNFNLQNIASADIQALN